MSYTVCMGEFMSEEIDGLDYVLRDLWIGFFLR